MSKAAQELNAYGGLQHDKKDRAFFRVAAELVEAVSAGINEGGAWKRFTRDQELTIRQKFAKLEAAANE